MANLNSIYVGKVEAVNDPEKLGRVKVRVPHVYGMLGSEIGGVPLDDLPWAIPLALPAGETARSGGMDWLPEPGDQVAVQFLDGEPEKPVWMWMMQTIAAAEGFAVHEYDQTPGPAQGTPLRAALSRYGHTLEWNSGSLVLTTSKGYRLFALDATDTGSDGYLQMITQSGQFLELNDQSQGGLLNILEDFYMQIGLELNILAGNIRIETAADFDVYVSGNSSWEYNGNLSLTGNSGFTGQFVNNYDLSATQINLSPTAQFNVTSPLMRFGSGVEPFVRGTQFTAWATALLAWLSTHIHTSATPGSPTSPPTIPPAVVQPPVATLISQTIFGE